MLNNEADTSQTPSGHETVLVVDDEAAVRGVTRHMLEKIGYTVLEAQRSAEALSLCEQYPGPIHVLITDIVMPQMDGRALANCVAALRPEIKVLFMSGYTNDAGIGPGSCEGKLAFLAKPFTVALLAQKVREVLDH